MLSTKIGTEPDQMVAPVVIIDTDPTLIAITWQELSPATNGGLTISSYKIEVLTSEGVYEESAECDGTDPTVMTNLECKISIVSLLESPFTLAQGELVQVRVTAVNSIGGSVPSIPNSVGAEIELVPHKPPTAPTKNYSTTQTTLVINYLHLEGTANGGSEVLSYSVVWDQGTDTWVEL